MSLNSGKLDASAAIVLDRKFTTSRNGKKSSHIPSTAQSSKMVARVRYQDFLPSGAGKPSGSFTPESFQQLVSRANDWLRKNTSAHVRGCETVTWLSHDLNRLDDSEMMIMSKKVNPNSTTHFCRGLRLWLVPRTVRRTETISCRDFVCEKPSDTIQTLIEKANKKFGHPSCKDQILTIETIGAPILSRSIIESSATTWQENGDYDSPYSFIVRVFYTKEGRIKQMGSHGSQIGLKDFVPRPTENGYEGFEALVERSNAWLKDQNEILVTNIQSITVQKNTGPHSETGSVCYYTMPGINNENPTEFFRILRIAYLKAQGNLLLPNLPSIHPFDFKTFAPEVLRGREAGRDALGSRDESLGTDGAPGPGESGESRMERMKETFARALAHLRTSGCELICAETVLNPTQFYTEKNMRDLMQADELSFLLTLRLYLSKEGGYDQETKRASISSKGRTSPSQENDHPGPIFLRNVVTRRYKYRWLAVGIFAVTCMTIIVVLSVVYSNR